MIPIFIKLLIIIGAITSLTASSYFIVKGWKKIRIYPDKLQEEYAKQLRLHNIFLIFAFALFLVSLILINTLLFYGSMFIVIFASIASLYLYHTELAEELKDYERLQYEESNTRIKEG